MRDVQDHRHIFRGQPILDETISPQIPDASSKIEGISFGIPGACTVYTWRHADPGRSWWWSSWCAT